MLLKLGPFRVHFVSNPLLITIWLKCVYFLYYKFDHFSERRDLTAKATSGRQKYVEVTRLILSRSDEEIKKVHAIKEEVAKEMSNLTKESTEADFEASQKSFKELRKAEWQMLEQQRQLNDKKKDAEAALAQLNDINPSSEWPMQRYKYIQRLYIPCRDLDFMKDPKSQGGTILTQITRFQMPL